MGTFKESEHPRDKDGKFTDKGAEYKSRIKRLRENFERRKQRKTKSRVGRLIEKRKVRKIGLQFFAEEALKTQTIREIRKGIRTLDKRIAEHQEKIANPQNTFTEWETFTEERKHKEINHWKNEIISFREAIKNREEEIEKRGNNDT